MSDHAQTIEAIVGVASFCLGAGAVAVKRVTNRLDRVVDAYEQVAGKPAKLDRSGTVITPAVPGLPARVDEALAKIDVVDRGNVEIMRKQDEAKAEHVKLAGRVSAIESKVQQTLNAVTP